MGVGGNVAVGVGDLNREADALRQILVEAGGGDEAPGATRKDRESAGGGDDRGAERVADPVDQDHGARPGLVGADGLRPGAGSAGAFGHGDIARDRQARDIVGDGDRDQAGGGVAVAVGGGDPDAAERDQVVGGEGGVAVVIVVQRRGDRGGGAGHAQGQGHHRGGAVAAGDRGGVGAHPGQPAAQTRQVGGEDDARDRIRARREHDVAAGAVGPRRSGAVGKVLVVERQGDRRTGLRPGAVGDGDRLHRIRGIAVAVGDPVAERGIDFGGVDEAIGRIEGPIAIGSDRVYSVGGRELECSTAKRRPGCDGDIVVAKIDMRNHCAVSTGDVVGKHVTADRAFCIFGNHHHSIVARDRLIVDDPDRQGAGGGVAVGIGDHDREGIGGALSIGIVGQGVAVGEGIGAVAGDGQHTAIGGDHRHPVKIDRNAFDGQRADPVG